MEEGGNGGGKCDMRERRVREQHREKKIDARWWEREEQRDVVLLKIASAWTRERERERNFFPSPPPLSFSSSCAYCEKIVRSVNIDKTSISCSTGFFFNPTITSLPMKKIIERKCGGIIHIIRGFGRKMDLGIIFMQRTIMWATDLARKIFLIDNRETHRVAIQSGS